MRIFFYNWVQFDDPEKRGGGVTLYQRNLIETLSAQGHNIVFLSSGIAYNILTRRSYIRPTRNCFGESCASFELVNSPVLAPSHSSFDLVDAQFSETEIRPILVEFLQQHGPFDAAHFNNLEGLPISATDLKSEFPGTRFVYSAHNYFSVCPQVNLWQNEEKNCADFATGKNCVGCLKTKPNPTEERLANCLAFHLKSVGIAPGTLAFRGVFQLARIGNRVVSKLLNLCNAKSENPKNATIPESNKSFAFARRRSQMVSMIEKNFDTILAVSVQTRHVLSRFGFSPDRVDVSYIGTKHGHLPSLTTSQSKYDGSGPLTIAYLGYMRTDKGFWFLLETLETLPPEMAGRINLIVAAKDNGKGGRQRLAALGDRFNKVKFIDGYTQNTIGTILSKTDLGIVPPLWEDNLPQVAIEMVAHNVPILTSDTGGAQELGNNRNFVFKAGSRLSLQALLGRITQGQLDLSDFWRDNMHPTSMQDHVDELLQYYQPVNQSDIRAAAR